MDDERKRLRWITQPCTVEEGLTPVNIGPFLPIAEDEVDSFNGALSDEVDSSFASIICCCDYCYADFKAHWPDIPFRNMEFQTQSMGSEWLVDYSRLPDVYSPAEISTLRGLVQCPRCHKFGSANVYVFEHNFSDVEEIEQSIEELSQIGNQTPFLLLENDFAQRVHAEIKRSISAAKTLALGTRLFRARLEADVLKLGQSPSDEKTYGSAPARFVGEGRFNHAGCPVIYLADQPDLAGAEIGQPASQCLVGEFSVVRSLQYLDLLDIDEDLPGYEVMSALVCSALLTAPHTGEGWVKQQYIFSRFVSDCARSAGFDAIRYGSTKLVKGSNFVILTTVDDPNDLLRFVSHSRLVCSEPEKRY